MWTQNYDPVGIWQLSTAIASLPVIVLLGLLASGKASAWQAAVAGLITAAVAAVGVFKMPVDMAIAAATYGLVFALFRIVWLIVAAVFLYDLAVATGQFDIMKASIATFGRQKTSSRSGRFFFRGIYRGCRRFRCSGRDFRGVLGWAGIRPFSGSGPMPHRKYRPGGLGSNWDSDQDPFDRDRPGR